MRAKVCVAVMAALMAGQALQARAERPGQAGFEPGGADRVLLRLRLEKGKSYLLKVTMDQKIVQTVMGNEQKITQKMGMGYAFDITDVDADGMMSGKVTYKSVVFEQQGPMGLVKYDSENPPEKVHPMAAGFAALAGSSFTMKMTALGRVKELAGVSEMLKKIISDLPDGPQKKIMAKQFETQFGDKAIGEMMENMMAYYPDKAVGVGGRWVQTMILSKGFPMTIENTYTLKDRKNGTAILGVASTIKPNKKAEPLKMGQMTMTYTMTGTQEGTLSMDEATGWIRAGTLKQDIAGEIKLDGIPGADQPMNLPMTVKSEITYESTLK